MYSLTNAQYLKHRGFVVTSTILSLWALPLVIFPFFFQRSEFWTLSLCFFASLAGYFLYLRLAENKHFFSLGIFAGISIRFVLLFSPIFLSEDVFRFLWDGLILQEGISPYSILPKEIHFVSNEPWREELLVRMNSPSYYSVYPPILQILFLIPAWFMKSFQSVYIGTIFWKGIVFLFELGFLFLARSVNSKKENLSFLIYWLHPLVLWEGVGNGHPEPILIFFLFGAAYQWQKKKFFLSGVSYITAILTKLIPLLLLPYLFFLWVRKLSFRKVLFLGLAGLLLILAFFYVSGIDLDLHFLRNQWEDGIGVYFNLFEYHGGIYYITKILLKHSWYPYSSGLLLAFISLASIFIYSFLKHREEEADSFVRFCGIWVALSGIYYTFSSTIHPWYILPIFAASIFSKNVWPIAASAIWIVSYSTYQKIPYLDQNWALLLEYSFVLGAFLYEIVRTRRKKTWITKNMENEPNIN